MVRRPFDLAAPDNAAPFRILFYSGTILPDLLSRPFYIIFPSTYLWITALHTPLAMLIIITMLSLLFHSGIRKRVFLNLCGGAALHFLLDALQKHVSGNNFWLFPFSWKNFSYGVAWPEDILLLIPVWIILAFITELIVRKREKQLSGLSHLSS